MPSHRLPFAAISFNIYQHLYPSSSFVESYDNSAPEIYAGVIALTFVLVAIVFFVYDMFVQRRNTKIVNKAAQSNGLVTSMIPDHLRDRLIGEQEREQGQKGKGNLKAFMADSANTGGPGGTGSSNKPLADLFLETTVMVSGSRLQPMFSTDVDWANDSAALFFTFTSLPISLVLRHGRRYASPLKFLPYVSNSNSKMGVHFSGGILSLRTSYSTNITSTPSALH